jgi:hypothetical protein
MELDYRFAPPAYPNAPGSSCLKVNINQTPTLESETPILRQGKMFEIPTQLAFEIRILISKRAAARLPDPSKHQKLQACAEPMELYAACLKALKAKYENYKYQDLTHVIEMKNLITNEIIALQDINRWPVSISVLEELL